MNCDINRINTIENILKTNPNSISNNDLIYYLQCNSNNQSLDSNNLTKTEQYLKNVNNSYIYENIFINTSNYGSVVIFMIGLLIPFYYFYPTFYKIGFWGYLIGFISLLGLYSKITSLYSYFFDKIGIFFIFQTFIIYIFFFIILNNLNHISLFFISAILSYLIINYITRVVLTIPLDSNIYNQYRATMNNVNSSTFTEYNVLLETACYLVIERYSLTLPSGTMLYTYLTEFTIGTNTNIYSDFFTNLFGPFIILFILHLLGIFYTLLFDKDFMPIIGMEKNSIEYFLCQANYILPKKLNIGLLIQDYLKDKNYSDNIYNKIEKALLRISNELLHKYEPKFKNKNNNQKDNQINIFIKENISYNNNSNLAFQEFLNDIFNDTEIKKNEKEELKEIVRKYIQNFKDNLVNKTPEKYDYNIFLYTLFDKYPSIKNISQSFFKNIIYFLSIWLLLAKPIGSSWVITKYLLLYKQPDILYKELMNDSFLFNYFTMGFDKDLKINVKETSNNSMVSKGFHYIYMILILIITIPILYMYNNIIFGMTLNPSWYNILYQVLFIINIFGNILCYQMNISLVLFNIVFIILFIIINVLMTYLT
jgi:hypothetical protein